MSLKRKRKVPFIEQLQLTECGLCCICMILRFYKSYETLQELRTHLDLGRDGSTLKQLNSLMKQLNFTTKIYRSSVAGLSQIKLPAILFWNENHFVVLEKINKKFAYIIDPACGRVKIEISEFSDAYSGYALTGSPKEDFVPRKKKKSIWFYFLPIIFQKKLLFMKIGLFSLISYFLTIGMPIFIQNLIDNVMLKKDFNYFKNSFIFLGIFSLIYLIFNFMKNSNLIKLRVIIDKSITSTVVEHLLKVPYKFFDMRNKADLLFSVNSCYVIRETFATQMINGLIDCGAVIFIIYYMYHQSILLTGVATILFIINLIIVSITQPLMLEHSRYLITEQNKVQSIQVETLFSMLGIKMSATEKDIYDNWNKKYEHYLNKYENKEKISNYIQTLMSFVQMISPLIILCVGIYLSIMSLITVGQVIAFYSLSTTFFSLSYSVLNIWLSFINSTLYLERLGDIVTTEVENQSKELIKADIKGSIRLNNVSFSYSKNSKQIIRKVNLNIKTGEKVAIVGKSGAGKSTLAKLLVGLYTPTEGDIFFDDIHIDKLDKKYIRKQMGIVPQDVSLFNKDIYANIVMDREDISLEKVKKSCQIAQIADDIENMPMGYNTIISEMGMNLSGGQRQRIVLSRAILSEPKVLLFDEATSSLDYINEKQVSDYFTSMGCTRIIIAHRLSTIIDSDNIIVLDEGEIVEQGSHEELMKNNGVYSMLYKSNKSNSRN